MQSFPSLLSFTLFLILTNLTNSTHIFYPSYLTSRITPFPHSICFLPFQDVFNFAFMISNCPIFLSVFLIFFFSISFLSIVLHLSLFFPGILSSDCCVSSLCFHLLPQADADFYVLSENTKDYIHLISAVKVSFLNTHTFTLSRGSSILRNMI